MGKMRYRLGLDLGTNSIGWAMLRLNEVNEPCAVIKAGVRIFSDGRNPKDGSSLAVSRRLARSMRRRRDRLLKRKARLIKLLTDLGFFPADPLGRKALLNLDPLELRVTALDRLLNPAEFARAIFHLNQRRGFKSNRKTDKSASDSGALKTAISETRKEMITLKHRTVGEYLLHRRKTGLGVRARYRETRTHVDGKNKVQKSYDLYIDRQMIEEEFDAMWASQAAKNPSLFCETSRALLKDCLLFQRPLRPVKPGRCTFFPEEERAPIALPSVQQFRMLQELNNLRILGDKLTETSLDLSQRNKAFNLLNAQRQATFGKIRTAVGAPKNSSFNLEDAKRPGLKGNLTAAILSAEDCFGDQWYDLSLEQQDEVVLKLLHEENEGLLVAWLINRFGVNESAAERIANVGLPEGYGSLSCKAVSMILPKLVEDVITYDKAVQAAGIPHHSDISAYRTGEILESLPYYGEPLQRHVGFGTGDPKDPPEKRFGRIANPTVHIGLNQTRLIVNQLIKRYGHPSEVIVEVARDLKQSQDQRKEDTKRQAENQKRNDRIRDEIAKLTGLDASNVTRTDVQKVILWEELSPDLMSRCCPYSGKQISFQMLMSAEVEIEHILPFSRTLDDSLNNKTVSLRVANRVKGNRTPAEAASDFEKTGWKYEEILERAAAYPKAKRYRFAEDGYEKWLKEDKDFLSRALNDTRYLSKIAFQYLALVCPQATRVIPGQMTAMLRGKFGLNTILGPDGEKNRQDHRHHAVDACVVAVTDQGLLQRFSKASASAREQQLNRLVAEMPLPWQTYRESVDRAIKAIKVSHRPDHNYQGAMHNDTAYGLLSDGQVVVTKLNEEGRKFKEVSNLTVIPFSATNDPVRHGKAADGTPLPYKGYKGDSNFCIEIFQSEGGRWDSVVLSTFEAYQIAKTKGEAVLYDKERASNGRPLVVRLMRDDIVSMRVEGGRSLQRVCVIRRNGTICFAPLYEANVDARNRKGELSYITKGATGLQKVGARRVYVSPVGEISSWG
jgi:CRISPR-associated endonuclease Csn1